MHKRIQKSEVKLRTNEFFTQAFDSPLLSSSKVRQSFAKKVQIMSTYFQTYFALHVWLVVNA